MNFRIDPILRFTADDLPIRVRTVARYFGGARYRLTSKAESRMRAMIEEAGGLISPVCTLGIWPVRNAEGDGFLLGDGHAVALPILPVTDEDGGTCGASHTDARYLAAVTATLGEGLEDRSRALADQKKIYDATLLDAVGIALLEALDVKIRRHIQGEAEKCGLFIGRRFSPGLEGYPMDHQKNLLDLAGADAAGIRINGAMIMMPVKSISFFMPVTETNGGDDLSGTKCRNCGKTDCQFRVAPGAPNGRGGD